MAKYEVKIKGNFQDLVDQLHKDILGGSASVSYEDGSIMTIDQVQIAVRVYERYSMMGGNRVSMSITIVGKNDELWITAITAGGSQAVFFKINTLGEESFIKLCKRSIEQYRSKNS